MRDFKVSVKLIISFTIVIVMTGALAIEGQWGMRQIKQAADDMYRYNVVAINALGLIRENFALQRNATRELLIYRSTSEEYRRVAARLTDLEKSMDGYIAEYKPTIIRSDDKEVFEEFLSIYYEEYGPYKLEYKSYANQDQDTEVMELIRTRADGIVRLISDILQEAHELNVKAAEESLRQNTEIYRTMAIIESAVLAVVVTVVILLVVYITRQISRPLRHMAEALSIMGSTGNMTMDPELEKYAYTDMKRGDEIGMATKAIIELLKHVWSIERALSRIADGEFTVEVKTLSEKDTMGLSVVKVAESLHLMFEQLKNAEEAAQAASTAKSVFLAQMSHEIRTPLNAIMGMSLIISRTPENAEKTRASIKQVIQSSKHLLGILNDVLDISKIESGKFELSPGAFRLKAALSEVISIISQRCSEKRIELSTNMEELSDYVLIGDRMRLNQVLINLLGNAVKFTESGGMVRLLVDIKEERRSGVRIKYVVSDSGIGITKEEAERLFEPFEQADRETAQKYGGTGLGLSISRNLVGMMGGELKIDSEVGVGSTFYFELDMEKGELEEVTLDVKGESLDLCGKRILLAEDVMINREILRELLISTGVTIEEAENGAEAVAKYKESTEGWYDLIFMDIQMPQMDGYEAARRIRALDRKDSETVPIVAMTANAYKEDVERCLQAGMNAHVSKPIEMESLIRTIRDQIR